MTPTHSPRPYDDDAQELLRTNIRPMLISPNLRAALEYDELSRNNPNSMPGPSRRSLDASVPLVGLPPPPRPKSRTPSLRRIRSPPTQTDATDGQVPPSAPGSPSPLVSPASPPVAWNPYINPPPRLPHLMVDSPAAMVFPVERRSSVNGYSPRSSLDSRVGDSPRSETRPSPLNSSPEIAGPPDAKPVFQRHFRYLSSLSKVDKLLLIGKSLASGKSEGKSRVEGRRASDASSLGEGEQPGGSVAHRRKLVRSRCSSGESGSSLGSPLICASGKYAVLLIFVFPCTTVAEFFFGFRLSLIFCLSLQRRPGRMAVLRLPRPTGRPADHWDLPQAPATRRPSRRHGR